MLIYKNVAKGRLNMEHCFKTEMQNFRMTVSDSEAALEPVEGAFPVNLSNTTQVKYTV